MRAKIKYRFLARIADFIICLVALALVLVVTNTSSALKIIVDGSTAEVDALFIINLLGAGVIIAVFLLFYSVIIPYFFDGRTIGMFLFKIHIVNEDNSKPEFFAIFIRQFLAQDFLTIITLGLTDILSMLLVPFRRDRHSIADIFSRTKVVDFQKVEEE